MLYTLTTKLFKQQLNRIISHSFTAHQHHHHQHYHHARGHRTASNAANNINNNHHHDHHHHQECSHSSFCSINAPGGSAGEGGHERHDFVVSSTRKLGPTLSTNTTGLTTDEGGNGNNIINNNNIDNNNADSNSQASIYRKLNRRLLITFFHDVQVLLMVRLFGLQLISFVVVIIQQNNKASKQGKHCKQTQAHHHQTMALIPLDELDKAKEHDRQVERCPETRFHRGSGRGDRLAGEETQTNTAHNSKRHGARNLNFD